MAIVVYKCDTCKREIEVPQVINGLEVMSRCIITEGCKGTLKQTQVKTSHIRGKLPDPAPVGLKDWLPRQLYYKQQQPIPLRRWKVKHNLGTNPSIQVHINLSDGQQLEVQSYVLSHISPFEAQIEFDEPRSGVVQCYARSTLGSSAYEVVNKSQSVQIESVAVTGNQVLTLAVPTNVPMSDLGLKIGFAVDRQYSLFPIPFTSTTSPQSPWWVQPSAQTGQLARVTFSGSTWDVQTSLISYDILNSKIIDGSKFFITTHWTLEPISIDIDTNVIVVNGVVDTSLIPQKTIFINNRPFSIHSSIINAVTKQTMIQVVGSLSSDDLDQPIAVDRVLEPTSVYVLLSTSPHQYADKNINAVIDVSRLTHNIDGATQVGGQLIVTSDLVSTMYPPVTAT